MRTYFLKIFHDMFSRTHLRHHAHFSQWRMAMYIEEEDEENKSNGNFSTCKIVTCMCCITNLRFYRALLFIIQFVFHERRLLINRDQWLVHNLNFGKIYFPHATLTMKITDNKYVNITCTWYFYHSWIQIYFFKQCKTPIRVLD